jgi:hypothetical protein
MYKFNSLIAFCILCFLSVQAQNSNSYNYITSGYYQLVYEADIAHMEDNDSLAFALLQQAEMRCPLINQGRYQEIDLYCHLLLKNGQFNKAIAYMDSLAINYGTLPVSVFKNLGTDSIMRKELLLNVPDFYDSIFPKLFAKSNSFYTSEKDSLVTILNEMGYNDQNIRQGWKNRQTFDFNKMQKTDSINLVKIFEIIDKYGFPNERLFGSKDFLLPLTIDAICMHNYESQKLQEMLIRFVREGKCSPHTYGFFVDRRMLDERKKHIFAIYSNVTDDRIFDLEFVNQRRLSIGMPTREMEQRRN